MPRFARMQYSSSNTARRESSTGTPAWSAARVQKTVLPRQSLSKRAWVAWSRSSKGHSPAPNPTASVTTPPAATERLGPCLCRPGVWRNGVACRSSKSSRPFGSLLAARISIAVELLCWLLFSGSDDRGLCWRISGRTARSHLGNALGGCVGFVFTFFLLALLHEWIPTGLPTGLRSSTLVVCQCRVY